MSMSFRVSLMALLLVAGASLADEGRRPNIVFILADDLGYTDLACFGSKYYETPHLDRLASRGMKFTDAHTCGPNCQPTRAALMTGQYGPRTGIYTVGGIDRFPWPDRPLRPVDNVVKLAPEKTTVAEVLRAAGYRTGMFGKWHLGEDAEHHPRAQGFDEAIVSMGRHFGFATNPRTEVPKGAYLADWLTDRAVQFLRDNKARPFFLYLPHFGVHSPHEAKPELIERFRKKPAAGGHHDPVYAAMISSVDESVGRVVAELDALRLTDNTLVIFSSDNGGVGGYDREGLNAKGITDNAPLRSGKGSLYEGGHRVPFIATWPGRVSPGTTCTVPILSVDLLPTCADVARAERPQQPLDGTSLVPLLTNHAANWPRDAIFWHFPGYLGAGQGTWRTTPVSVVRMGRWKLLEFLEDGRRELYDLDADLGERKNLVDLQPTRARELHDRLVAWRESVGAPLPKKNTEAARTPTKGKAKSAGKRRSSSNS